MSPGGFSRFLKASAACNNQNVSGTSEVLEPPSLAISACPLLPWRRGSPCTKPATANAPLPKRAAAFVLCQFVSLLPSLVLLSYAGMSFSRLQPVSVTSDRTARLPPPQVRRCLAHRSSTGAKPEKENILVLATWSVYVCVWSHIRLHLHDQNR